MSIHVTINGVILSPASYSYNVDPYNNTSAVSFVNGTHMSDHIVITATDTNGRPSTHVYPGGGTTYVFDNTGLFNSPPYRIVDTQLVDNEPWCTVAVNREVASWLRKQDINGRAPHEHEHRGLSYFDIPEPLLVLLKLRW